MDIIRAAALAILTAALSLVVKQYRPEYAMLVQLGGVIVTALSALALVPSLTQDAASLLAFGGIDGGWLILLVKALGIAILTELAADICRDNGVTALAGITELAGKAMILLLCLPLLRAVAEIAAGLIGDV